MYKRLHQSPALLAIKLLYLSVIVNFIYLIILIISDVIEIDNDSIFTHIVRFHTEILIILIFLQFIAAVLIFLQWYNNYYEYENNIITHYSGVFIKRQEQYHIKNAESIKYNKSFFGKIFNYGDVFIKDILETEEIKISAVPFPDEYANKLQENYRAFTGQIISKGPEIPKMG